MSNGIDIEGAMVAAAIKSASNKKLQEAIYGFMDKHETLDGQGVMKTPERLAIFFGQTAHESSGFTRRRESTYYSSAERIKAIFGRGNAGRERFPTLASCEPYVKNKIDLANYVYQNRLGNGDEASGDGWKFRGAGWLQLTGRDNYRIIGTKVGINLVKWPELAAGTQTAWLIASEFFRATKLHNKNLFQLADQYDVEGVTRGVNGGMTGFTDRLKRSDAALAVLKQTWSQ